MEDGTKSNEHKAKPKKKKSSKAEKEEAKQEKDSKSKEKKAPKAGKKLKTVSEWSNLNFFDIMLLNLIRPFVSIYQFTSRSLLLPFQICIL